MAHAIRLKQDSIAKNVQTQVSTGSRENVDGLTERLRSAGYQVVSGPRVTGDGYYESQIIGIEGLVLEITV